MSMVETAKTSEPLAQPDGSGNKIPDGSKGKTPEAEGVIIGLRKQLAKAKDRIKTLEAEVSAPGSLASEEGGRPGWTEDDQAKKEFAKLQKRIRELEGAKAKSDKEAKILKLSNQTGIPLEVLSDAEDDYQLAIKIAEWKNDSKKEEKKEETPTKPSAFEAGGAAPGTEKNVWEMSKQEFAKYGEQLEAENRKR